MTNPIRRTIPMLAAGAFCLGATFAQGADPASSTSTPTVQQLQAQVQQLQTQVQQLSAQQQTLNAHDVDATVDAVLHDAAVNSQLLDGSGGGFTGGFANNRFYIGSEDGDFTLKPWIHIQVRNSTNFRRDGKNSGADDDTENGFELRRARFGFDGNLFGKDFTYFINWATNRENSTLTVKNGTTTVGTTSSPVGGLPVLEEAWMKYHIPDSSFYVKGGQMHDPLDHENIVGSKYRAPEASLQGDIFGNTDTFTQGATLIYDPKGCIRTEGGVTDGIRAANTNFEDAGNLGIEYDGGVAGRVEYKVMGNWKDYDQLTAFGDTKRLLVLGAGADYSYGGDYSEFSHVLDAQYGDPSGMFVYLCYFGRYSAHNQGIPTGGSVSTSFGTSPDKGKNTYEPSVDILVSHMIGPRLEPFIRYEYMYLKGTPSGSQNNVHDISVGANYYFHGHNLKATGMATYLPNGIPISDDSSDVLLSNNKAEFVFIAQIQLLL